MSDLISRADAIEAIQNAYCKPCKERGDDHNEVRCRACAFDDAIIQIDALPSADAVSRKDTVTLNSPISIQADMVSVVRCKDCKYFELDHFDRIDDMPIITAHEICTKWNGGCKTSKDGFCFMGERREK